MSATSHINPALTELGDKFTQLEPDSITVEEGDLLYALVRMKKPGLAIETGTGHGCSTRRIAEALAENGSGLLISCDTYSEYVDDARLSIPSMFVEIRRCTGIEVLAHEKPDFILVDAGDVGNRMEELKLIMERDILSKNGLLVIHDAINGKYKQLIAFVEEQGWPGLVFESLAGIAVFQHP
jgi:predicted O-methyltransferase YrrM